MGIDLGERRIGIAVSDSGGVLASPYTVVERSGDAERDRSAIARIVSEVGGEIVVVGMPLSLSGAKGPAATAAEAEATQLRHLLEVPVVTFDERLTTVEAERMRRERSTGRAGAGRENRKRPRKVRSSREAIDAEAAAIMLGAWLEAQT